MRTIKEFKKFIKDARETPYTDSTYGNADEWDEGYNACLSALEDLLDVPCTELEDHEGNVKKRYANKKKRCRR